MGDLTMHFDRSEFACSCGCGFDTVDFDLLEILAEARDYFNKPITINSAARCLIHNRTPVSEGGAGSNDKSQHVIGKAADIVIDGVDPSRVADYFEDSYQGGCGIGRYKDFTHIDSRDYPARWDKT